jgi:hypothetical protein
MFVYRLMIVVMLLRVGVVPAADVVQFQFIVGGKLE